MRTGFRTVIASAAVSSWIGLLIGLANTITVVLVFIAASSLQGSILGFQVSALGWLATQVKTMALDILGFTALGVGLGVVLAILLGALLLILPARLITEPLVERLFYSGFATAMLLVPALILIRIVVIVTISDRGLPRFLPYAAAGAMLALVGALGYVLYRRLAKLGSDDSIWLHAGVLIGWGAFYILGLRGLVQFLDGSRYILAGVLILGWTVFCWLFLGACTSLVSRWGKRFLSRLRVIGLTAAAVVFLLILFIGIYRAPPRESSQEGSSNVILIVLDTVRADHCSAYGYQRPTTPVIARMADGGLIFGKAFSAAPWTMPSHATFFTGLYPSLHHCTHEHLELDSEFITLAEIFHSRGYATLGYSNNPMVGAMSGMDQGFGIFIEGWRPEMSLFTGASIIRLLFWIYYPEAFPEDAGAADTVRMVERWLSDLAESRSPFFLFINLMEAHPPMPEKIAYRFFDSPENARRRLARVKNDFIDRDAGMARLDQDQTDALLTLYDGEIRYLDDAVGRIVKALDKDGLSRSTVVAVISDHGEMFDEHGGLWGHERTLYDSLLHVPLVIYAPGQIPGGSRVEDPVSLRELPAMLLALSEGQGMSGVMEAAMPDRSDLGGILAEVARPVGFIKVVAGRFPSLDTSSLDRRQKALISYPWKLIWDSRGEDALFNLEDDPGETENLARHNIRIYHELWEEVYDFRLQHPLKHRNFHAPNLDQATIKKLRALGYLP